ncbi:MAG: restriction endonuclease [Candidatus Bathyarchaeia archaeon]
MSTRRFPDIISFYFIGVSLLGLCLLAVLTFSIPISATSFPLQKQLTGSIFTAICLLGITAGVYPSRCSRMLHFRRDQSDASYKTNQAGTRKTTIRFEGHHPTCGNFSAHVLQLGSKTYCAGCTGLVAGAIISVLGSFMYFFAGLQVGGAGILVFSLGFLGVACGLLQYNLLNANRGAVHLSLNVTFVVGAFLLLVGVNEMTSNFILELYLLSLTVYWIITRVMLSNREHEKICATCGLKSCI